MVVDRVTSIKYSITRAHDLESVFYLVTLVYSLCETHLVKS